MRNLKKILAMALALIMSLSLMVTASAKVDFNDQDQINPEFETAIDVLNELGVLTGDTSGFRPGDPITRKEVAAILYRVFTGDVGGPGNDNSKTYASSGPFADVSADSWYAGYINFAYDHGSIKGSYALDGVTRIAEPDTNVTGYQVLAMILRAVGYDKNNEFIGTDWQVHVASTAYAEHVLDNYQKTGAQLSAAATREEVAEMIFQSILLPKVTFDFNKQDYTKNAASDTIAMERLGLERVEGVVLANEWAALDNDTPMSSGRTELDTADKGLLTLNVSSELIDLGQSRYAYVKKGTQTRYDMVLDELKDTGKNAVYDAYALASTDDTAPGGKSTKVATAASSIGAVTNAATEYYTNYGEGTTHLESDVRIEYVIDQLAEVSTAATESAARNAFYSKYRLPDDAVTVTGSAGNYVVTYVAEDDTTTLGKENAADRMYIDEEDGKLHVIIPPEYEVTTYDYNRIQNIFYWADREDTTSSEAAVETSKMTLGEVYVRTQSLGDISDDISFKQFVADYLDPTDDDQRYTDLGRGVRLIVIDNDDDGYVDYVLRTWYVLDEIKSYSTRTGYSYYGSLIATADDEKWLYDDDQVGDVILYALIDGVAYIEKAPMTTNVIKAVDYRSSFVTTAEDELNYYKSDALNLNQTQYASDILDMKEKLEYEIFYDKDWNILAYRETKGSTSYALLTEMYESNAQNSWYINDNHPIVELKAGEEDLDEFDVNNFSVTPTGYLTGNPFINYFTFTNTNNTFRYKSILRKSTGELGTAAVDTAYGVDSDEFDYWDYAGTDYLASRTNVARYTLNSDGTVSIYGAAKYAYDRSGNRLYYLSAEHKEKVTESQWIADYLTDNTLADNATNRATAKTAFDAANLDPVYEVNYIQLAQQDIKKADEEYLIAEGNLIGGGIPVGDDGVTTLGPGYNYADQNNEFVNAIHSTEYYLVSTTNRTTGGISYFTDYEEVPAISADQIHAIYAVARNIEADSNEKDYWVADVIVIELEGTEQDWDSISAAYFNSYKQSGDTRWIDTLNNEHPNVEATVIPATLNWPGTWYEYGFFKVYETGYDGDKINASKIEKIGDNYNYYGIYAGVVLREAEVEPYGDYIVVSLSDDTTGTRRYLRNLSDVPCYTIGGSSANNAANYPDVKDISLSDIETGDRIIWVYNHAGDIAFIINVSYNTSWYQNATWTSEWGKITFEEKNGVSGSSTGKYTITAVADEDVDVYVEGVASYKTDSTTITVTLTLDDPVGFSFAGTPLTGSCTGATNFYASVNADDSDAIDVTIVGITSSNVVLDIDVDENTEILIVSFAGAPTGSETVYVDGEEQAAAIKGAGVPVRLGKHTITFGTSLATNLAYTVASTPTNTTAVKNGDPVTNSSEIEITVENSKPVTIPLTASARTPIEVKENGAATAVYTNIDELDVNDGDSIITVYDDEDLVFTVDASSLPSGVTIARVAVDTTNGGGTLSNYALTEKNGKYTVDKKYLSGITEIDIIVNTSADTVDITFSDSRSDKSTNALLVAINGGVAEPLTGGGTALTDIPFGATVTITCTDQEKFGLSESGTPTGVKISPKGEDAVSFTVGPIYDDCTLAVVDPTP